MAIKKSELYSSLWASCDELRGGMDAYNIKIFRRWSNCNFDSFKKRRYKYANYCSWKMLIFLNGLQYIIYQD